MMDGGEDHAEHDAAHHTPFEPGPGGVVSGLLHFQGAVGLAFDDDHPVDGDGRAVFE